MDLPNKKYNIIYADPAWKYNDKRVSITSDRPERYGGISYDVMDIEELCKLPIKEIADDNCTLFMWVTMPLLQDCFKVIEAWGFKYRTCGFVWVKKTDSGKFRSGLGSYTNCNAELCLIAIKGKCLERKNKDIKQIIYTPVIGHSRKPSEVYTRIEKLYGDVPRIELFARERRQGWDVWGNELPDTIQKIIPLAVNNKKEENGSTMFENVGIRD